MLPRSVSLFHFTKNMEILKAVLKEGFWPRYCLEDVKWQGREQNDFIAYPMVCFCDIPISRISEHVKFYGDFGIGLTKEWGAKNNLNPVFYFSGDNPVHGAIKNLTNAVGDLEDIKKKSSYESVRYILAYSKPTKGRMILSGETELKDFYQESEWRFVPQHKEVKDFLSLDDYKSEDILSASNEKTNRLCRLKFSPKDVKYIFVPKDSEIPAIMNFIQAELDTFTNADLKLLMSRVTSLESISSDV